MPVTKKGEQTLQIEKIVNWVNLADYREKHIGRGTNELLYGIIDFFSTNDIKLVER